MKHILVQGGLGHFRGYLEEGVRPFCWGVFVADIFGGYLVGGHFVVGVNLVGTWY